MYSSEPVAIIGMACRFPGADTPGRLWANMLAGRQEFAVLDQQRWRHEAFLEGGRRSSSSRRAALVEDVDLFAAQDFGCSTRKAEAMDPQQRLILELAREALQDAGLERRPLDTSRSAVFIGASVSEYASLVATRSRVRQLAGGEFGEPAPDLACALDPYTGHTIAGSLLNMIAAGVAQHLGYQGPALSVDTACSSTLAALVQAMVYLERLPAGAPAPVALAGGVYLLLAPENTQVFARAGVLAEHDIHPYDHRAAGFLLGEGAGLFVLRRLSDALAAGDRVYAVIRGAALGSDGLGASSAAPQAEGQSRSMRAALAAAGLSPEGIGYVEGHGTGTPVGDATELEAISACWNGHPVYLGSAKANLGHCLSAAGAAGVMRAALAVWHGRIPPHAGWERWPGAQPGGVRIPAEPVAWTGPRRALVNSFGFGGSNGSLVLEQSPTGARERAAPAPSETGKPPWSVTIGAPTPELLAWHLAELHHDLAARGDDELQDWAATLSTRPAQPCAVTLAAETRAQVLRDLTALVLAAPTQAAPGPLLPGRLLSLPLVPRARKSYWHVKGRPPGPRGPSIEERWRRSGRLVLAPERLERGLLALACELLAWQAGAPCVLRDIRVERSLELREPTWCELADGQLRVDGQLYASARPGEAGQAPARGGEQLRVTGLEFQRIVSDARELAEFVLLEPLPAEFELQARVTGDSSADLWLLDGERTLGWAAGLRGHVVVPR